MNDATIFCLCLHDGLLEKVKQLGYTPVGLGKNNFSDDWIKDSSGLNISEKNTKICKNTCKICKRNLFDPNKKNV